MSISRRKWECEGYFNDISSNRLKWKSTAGGGIEGELSYSESNAPGHILKMNASIDTLIGAIKEKSNELNVPLSPVRSDESNPSNNTKKIIIRIEDKKALDEFAYQLAKQKLASATKNRDFNEAAELYIHYPNLKNEKLGEHDATILITSLVLASKEKDPVMKNRWLVLAKSLISEKGIDLNLKDKSGNTALHRAAWYGFSDISKLLIDKGAKLDIKNNNGETPLRNLSQKSKDWGPRIATSAHNLPTHNFLSEAQHHRRSPPAPQSTDTPSPDNNLKTPAPKK